MTRPINPRRQPSGRRPKHGSRALARYVREHRLDRRTWLSKAIEQTEDVLAADAGGFERLSERDRLRISLTASHHVEHQLLTWHRQGQLLRGEPTTETDKYYLASCNTLSRLLDALPGRVPEQLPSLSEYLAQKASGNGTGAPATPAAVQSEPPTAASPHPATDEPTP